jgi:hypothetical protein
MDNRRFIVSMKRLKALILVTTILLLTIALSASLDSTSNKANIENTYNALTTSVSDTSLGYDYNHTVQLTLNTTITNHGPLSVSFKKLNSTILLADKPVLVASLGEVTLRAGESLTLNATESVLNVPDRDESLYRALKARNLRIEADFSGIADVGGSTRIVTVSGNATTGFLHEPGEGIPGPADFPIKGSLNSRNVPRISQTYVNVVGTLGSTRFSPSLDYTDTIYNGTVDALTLITNDTYPENYILLTDSLMPVAYSSADYSNLRTLDKVYLTGMMFHYKGWDGKEYLVVIPVDVGSSKPLDFVELARAKIISQLGEVNYDRLFFNPMVQRYMDNDRGVPTAYNVEYLYPVWDGGSLTEFKVSVTFDPNGTVTESYGIPPIDNLAPYRVDSVEAKSLALKAGLLQSAYPLEFNLDYCPRDTGSDLPVWGDRYLWRITSWIDAPDSNPRTMKYAMVDPVTGVVYQISEFQIGFVGIVVLNP